MIPLRTSGAPQGVAETLIGRIEFDPTTPGALMLPQPRDLRRRQTGEPIVLTMANSAAAVRCSASSPSVSGIPSLDHLAAGDIVAVHPSGRIDTLYRASSPNNSLFVTERCNSRCLMCSQPPRDVEDIDYYFALNHALLELLPKSLPTLGMTGGEPTLLGYELADLITLVVEHLPGTQLEILSNGRALSRLKYANAIADVATDKILFTIPLYSDHAPIHDYIVQARHAFTQTVLGLHNLARNGVRAEIRIVLHRQSYRRLLPLAKFIHKNLPFIEHVAFMGMEHTGYARLHDQVLWIDPPAYGAELEAAVEYLSAFRYPVSLYNLQPCLVREALRPYLRVSISDWKREYLPTCSGCAVRDSCGGVFGTSQRQSQFIRAIPAV